MDNIFLNSWALYFLANVAHTQVNSAIVEDYFWLSIWSASEY